MTGKLVENSYLSALALQYPVEEEASLRQFLGWFNGSILVLSFIFQTFFNDRIIAEYGLRVSLAILPVILGVLAITVIAVGLLSGQTLASGAFFTFFLFVALSKLFITFLRDALENPAFKLYFMTLETKIRFDIQAKIEGVIVESAKVIAGAVVLTLITFGLATIVNFYYILVVVIGGWLFLGAKLYAEYRNRIRAKLESKDVALEEVLKSVGYEIREIE